MQTTSNTGIDARVPAQPVHALQAALLVHPPGAFLSHSSAARVYRLPVPQSPEVHVSVRRAADRRRRPLVRPHLAPEGATVRRVAGLPVSAPVQLFAELATELTLVDLVVVGDALVHRELATVAELRATAASVGTGPVGRLARRAASLVREDVDSPMESRLRMLIVLAGLPEPTVNVKVYDAAGFLLYRFDLSYPDLKVVVEYDGRQHRDDLDQWDHDSDRADWFEANGWRYVPVFSRGIYKQPEKTLQRVHAALRDRGCRDLPRQLSDEWRAYFPGHG